MANVLVVGDLSQDWVSHVDRLPEEDGKSTGSLLYRGPGGMSANVAVTLASLGNRVSLLAAVGEDDAGRQVTEAVNRVGVDTDGVRVVPGARTFTCLSFVAESGEKALVRLTSEAYVPSPHQVASTALEGHDHVHATLADADLARAVLARAAEHDCTTSLDVEEADLQRLAVPAEPLLRHVDIVFLARRAAVYVERRHPGFLDSRHGITVTTKGAEGSHAHADGRTIEAPAAPVTPLDTTGAGDAFAGAFLHARLEGWDLRAALAFANLAAAVSTRSYGAQGSVPTHAAIEALRNATA